MRIIISPGNTEAKQFTSGHESRQKKPQSRSWWKQFYQRKVVTKTVIPMSLSVKSCSRALTLECVWQILAICFRCKMCLLATAFILGPLGCSQHSTDKTFYLLRSAIKLVMLGKGHYLTAKAINLRALCPSICHGLALTALNYVF